jgi:hypothetical protein
MKVNNHELELLNPDCKDWEPLILRLAELISGSLKTFLLLIGRVITLKFIVRMLHIRPRFSYFSSNVFIPLLMP